MGWEWPGVLRGRGRGRLTPVARSRHALVVGGTGMLREVVRWLAEEGWTVSVVARGRARLRALQDQAERLDGSVRPIRVDYRKDGSFRSELDSAIGAAGPIELAICWIHSTAPGAPGILAEILGRQDTACRLFRLRGSVARDPSVPDRHDLHLREAGPPILYRRVILGYRSEGGGSRWLTDPEIASGVIEAVRSDAEETVVGIIEPWSARP